MTLGDFGAALIISAAVALLVVLWFVVRLLNWLGNTTDAMLNEPDYMGRPWRTIQPIKREDKPKVARPRDDMGRRSS